MDETQQVGTHVGAALWRGTPESYTSLHPAGTYSFSGASAVRDNMQVGVAGFPSTDYHAALWRGTAQSFVDLHPAGAVRSYCSSTDGILQGGWVDWPFATYATLWNGTAASYINLSQNDDSHIHAMVPGVQVGDIHIVGGYHAALWRGTRESFVDLHPPGSSGTRLFATTGTIHVGQGFIGGNNLSQAIINFGTPTAWLNLHQFLAAPYTSFSAANAVYQDGDTIYVGGYAENGNTGYNEAILWIGHLPCYANCDQSAAAPSLNVNDFMCFINSFASGNAAANCDQSTATPTLNVLDFGCFLNRFAAGCS